MLASASGYPVRKTSSSISSKLVAARPRDLEDAEKLLLLYGSSLDIPRIRRIVQEFAEALEDVARVQALERLLCSTGLGPP